MTTLISAIDDMQTRKLITRRVKPGTNLQICKYSKRVFYDKLWNAHPLLGEMRGIVVDGDTGHIVSYPFSKVYNYKEENAGARLKNKHVVLAVEKINGFLATVSLVDGEPLITTSGSFESDFVALATKVLGSIPDQIAELTKEKLLPSDTTYTFEIVDPSDPHIIEERAGAYLIGARPNTLHSRQYSEDWLDEAQKLLNDCCGGTYRTHTYRPDHWLTSFGDLKRWIKRCQIEGVMVRDAASGETICKFKSPFYLQLKFLSRSTFFLKPDFNREGLRRSVEEEFYGLIDYIYDVYGAEAFKSLAPSERVALLRDELSKQTETATNNCCES